MQDKEGKSHCKSYKSYACRKGENEQMACRETWQRPSNNFQISDLEHVDARF